MVCSSKPIYGEGIEAGNEAGYIVGMTTCYPSPAGPVKISAGETLTLVSNYSSVERHIGVMALFYLLLADSSLQPLVRFCMPFFSSCVSYHKIHKCYFGSLVYIL